MIDITLKGNMVLDFDKDLERVISKEKARRYESSSENSEAKEELYQVFKKFMITLYDEVLDSPNEAYYKAYNYPKRDVMKNLIDIVGSKYYRGIYIDDRVLNSLICKFNADKSHRYKYNRPGNYKTFRKRGRTNKTTQYVQSRTYVLDCGYEK